MTKVAIYFSGQKAFGVVVALLVLTIASYFIGIGLTIKNVLKRQYAEKAMEEISPKVSELEFSYLTLKASVDIDKAHELGFVDASEILVAQGGAHSLTLR